MPEMITVRCPRCGKKLLFSPFDNYKKASLECPGCHYTGLVETYPEIPNASSSQTHSQQPTGNTHGTPGFNQAARAVGTAVTGAAAAAASSHSSSSSHSSPSSPYSSAYSGGSSTASSTGSSSRWGSQVGHSYSSHSNSGIRDLDGAASNGRGTYRSHNSSSETQDQEPMGFAVKFPWVIAGLALAIIILFVCLQCISTNEVI